ncbi:MAG: fumarylacetoacetate hydrolase family protein [Rhodobiaceae bacterium]|jgi:2-keto-4-pentenoate hydratase/2-oxohepta-3-ene-1,7-dioic acid hydratase in catechol pathway|nr:fumarylacetoacetate hydrolase family protein [Rhodobiaceae bacterium]MBT5518302.1 fumarylacetoacetate hydrolase family protein [Rhodobiaceae bacterium]
MKLARYKTAEGIHFGLVRDDRIYRLAYDGSAQELIADWQANQSACAKALQGDGQALSDVALLAPVPRPGKIFAIGLNFADHIEESGMETPSEQIWFTKAVTSVNGPFDPIVIPKISQTVDYEVEMVAVIGKQGKNLSETEVADYIFGYCVGNDVTERFWQHRTPQWSLGKSFDTHAPIGPWITTADEIADPHALDLTCSVNGELRQSSNTKHLVFNIWQQISQLSQAMTLEPGDLIFTGTPGGVGAAMDPMVFLQEGDVLVTEIEKLGRLEGRLVNEG